MTARFPVGHLADMIHARDNPWKALVMIRATSYFDDSGTHRSSVATIIGGFVAIKAVWEQLEDSWIAILAEFADRDVTCFRASSCLWQGGQFKPLEKCECHYIYKQLSDILEKSDVHAIWAAVRNDDWKAVTDRNFKTVYGSAYDFCIDRVLSRVVNWSSRHAGGSKVGVVLAVQKEHGEETKRTFESWSAVSVVSDRIGALAYDFPQNLVPLQAADMLAHEVYRNASWTETMEVGHPLPSSEPTHPPCFAKITRFNRARLGGYYDKEDLEIIAGGIHSEP